MWRYFAGLGSALLLVTAGFFIWKGTAQSEDSNLVPDAPAESASAPTAGRPRVPPAADERSREQRRFDRADRDNDGRVTLAELTYGRRRNFDRLDTDHNGQLSFEEWAARTLRTFATADGDRDRALNRAEFAATAPRRRATARRQTCDCARQADAGGRSRGGSN
jgi:EF hand domain-containing protein